MAHKPGTGKAIDMAIYPPTNDELSFEAAELRALGDQLAPGSQERFRNVMASRARDLESWPRWYRANDEEQWKSAAHEAGHAAYAFQAGRTIETASVIPCKESSGRVFSFRDGVEDVESRIVGILAGPMAEQIIAGSEFFLSMKDGGDGYRVREIIRGTDEWLTMAEWDRTELFRNAKAKAREFVNDAVRPITLLAMGLCEFSVLSGRGIDQVFENDV